MKAFKRNAIIAAVLIAGITIGVYGDNIWNLIKNLGDGEIVVENGTPTQTPQTPQGRALPQGFADSGIKEKTVDLNNDGEYSLLLTNHTSAGANAVIVDSKNNSKALSNIFKFSSSGFAEAYAFKSEGAPEVEQMIDLNKDGRDEIIFELADSTGAYASAFGIVSYNGKTLAWVMLEEKNGVMRPAIFRDGASVRNAEIFKIEEGANRYIADVSGAGDKDGNWTWDVKVYKWNGTKYAFDATLSAQILAEQPKKIIDGEPVF